MPNEYPLRTKIFLIAIYRRHYKKKMPNPTPIGFLFFFTLRYVQPSINYWYQRRLSSRLRTITTLIRIYREETRKNLLSGIFWGESFEFIFYCYRSVRSTSILDRYKRCPSTRRRTNIFPIRFYPRQTRESRRAVIFEAKDLVLCFFRPFGMFN